jgi:hypothetical protein
MSSRCWLRARPWVRLVAVLLALSLVAGCQEGVARVGIPLAYGLTGLCLALLVSPTLTAAVVGFVVGCALGAAVYNNSVKT